MVIFKRKTIPKDNFLKDIIDTANEKGWINEETMKRWIDKIWKKRRGSFMSPSSLFVMDSCKVHLNERVKNRFGKSTKLAIIPGGLTKVLQPLDISVNRSFKPNLRKRWMDWMINEIHSFTKRLKVHLIVKSANGSQKVGKKLQQLQL
jgi:hypothetical protein